VFNSHLPLRNPKNRMIDGLVAHRCPGCRLLATKCLCDLVPTIETRTRVLVVLHQLETHKPSNTGHLALRCLPNSGAVIRGRVDRSTEVPDWAAHGDPVLLFPHEDARPLETWRDSPRPVTLIVPDGTWRQAARVRRRVPGLDAVPCAYVARDARSRYRLRHTQDPSRLSTMEAIAEALGVLEPANAGAARESLLAIFGVMVERSLASRTAR
jgi:DTW domain-containing protein